MAPKTIACKAHGTYWISSNTENMKMRHRGDLDALLIWAIDQHFGHSMDADILLVALGLVDGYHYDQLSLGRRRAKFLIDSNVIQAVSKINDDYVSASAKRKKELRDHNLRGIEDERIEKLADFLVEYTMHHNIDTLGQLAGQGGRWY